MEFDFSGLIIFEMANNHQGDIKHGLRIIEEMARISRTYKLRSAVKLQYRDLKSLIHPGFRERKDVPHIPRFLETSLKWEAFQELILAIREQGMLAVVTPFDEPSVAMALNHGVDVLKVASCSCTDWPLLEEIAQAQRPVICSTGGCSLADTDKIVSFFEHRQVSPLALLHCVGIYPTQDKDQQLHFMKRMMLRYPNCTIGYSGHEAPDNLRPAIAAVALGAQILERHVGVPTEQINLNKYSMNPEQTAKWVETVLEARQMFGTEKGGDKQIAQTELDSLRSLARGVFARRDVKRGEPLVQDVVFMAMPCQPGQTTAAEYLETMTATRDYSAGDPLLEARQYDPIRLMRTVVHEAKGLLREARVPLGTEHQVELSHHYGMDQFRRFGAIIVNFVNREYCKKLIVMLPGQYHPKHMHKIKEETFQVIFGDMELELDGRTYHMKPGSLQLVQRGQWHAFGTKTGLIFEEISTTHVRDDSFYEDKTISRLDPVQRKTVLDSF